MDDYRTNKDSGGEQRVPVRAYLTEAERREAKAAAALAGEDFQDYAGRAIMQRVERDKAARDQQQEG